MSIIEATCSLNTKAIIADGTGIHGCNENSSVTTEPSNSASYQSLYIQFVSNMENDNSNNREITDTSFQNYIDVGYEGDKGDPETCIINDGQSFHFSNADDEDVVLSNLGDLKNLPQRREAIADDKGYMYSIDKTLNGNRYLHCSRKKFGCLVRAIWPANGELEPQTCHSHNHIPDLRRLGVRRFTANFIDEVLERKGVSLKQIYLSLAAKYQTDASYVTYKQAIRALKRAKISAATHKIRTLTFSVGKKAKLPKAEAVNCTDFRLKKEASKSSVKLVHSKVDGPNNSAINDEFEHIEDTAHGIDSNYDSESNYMNLTCEPPENDKNYSLLDLEALSNLPQRRNAITDDQGYTYVLNRTTYNARYLRCSQRAAKGCLARAILRDDGILEPQDSPHNHEPNIGKIAVKRFNTAFILEAINRKGRTLKEIYNDTLAKHPEEASFASFMSAQRALKRAEQTSVRARLKNSDVLWNSFKIAGVRRPNRRKSTGKTNRNRNNSHASFEGMQTKEDPNDSHDFMDYVKEELDDTTLQEEQPLADEDIMPVPELLPGPKGKPIYYDGTGYYYNQTSEDDMYRWLECLHSGCDITARMERHKGAPITLLLPSTSHSHQPNPERRERICFLQRIKERNASEDTPFTIIFQEESHKNPIGASFFSFEKIEKHVMKKITNDSTNKIEITPKVPPTFTTRAGRVSTMKTMSKSSISTSEEPESKKRKISRINEVCTTPLSKKLELLKSLKDLNSSSTSPQGDSQPSQRLPGPDPHSFVYHDGSGYFYKAFCVSKNKRQLKCTTAGCPAQAVMGLELKSPIQLDDEVLPHNHPPKPLTSDAPERKSIVKTTSKRTPLTAASLGTNLHEDRNDFEALSEKVPTLLSDSWLYYDCKGFYYSSRDIHLDKRFVECVVPRCGVQGWMSMQPGASIKTSKPHLHGPQGTQPRDELWFIHRVKARVLKERDTPYTQIYTEEANKDPEGAALISEDEIRQLLDKLIEALSEKVPTLLSDSWLYYDCKGFYYSSRDIHLDKRFVECVVPRCGVQGWMSMQPGASIKTSKPHLHGPQGTQPRDELWFIHRVKARVLKERDTPYTQIYTEEANKDPEGAALISEDEIRQLLDKLINEQNLESVKSSKKKSLMIVSRQPAEKLPSPMFGSSWQYHDGKGYYYTCDKSLKASDVNNMYMKCIWSEWWGCQGRASMQAEGKGHLVMRAPHNHESDLLHRQLCLFSYALKQRTRDENTSLRHIYAQEAKKFPAAAASMKESKVMEKLIKIRKLVKSQMDIPAEGDEEEDIESDTEKEKYNQKPNLFTGLQQKWKSEKLQGRYKPVYHDGKGYYYLETFCSSSFRYLMCIEPQCVAQAKMGLEAGSPVLYLAGSYAHTHESDMLRRRLLLFLDTLRHRTRTELKIGVDTIYVEESHKEPVVAGQIAKDTLLRILNTIRHSEEMGIDTKAPQNDNENQVEEEELWAMEAVERLPSHEHRDWLYHDGMGHYYYSHHLHQPSNRMTLCCLEEKCQAEVWLSAGTIVRVSGSVLHNHRPDPLRRAQLLLLHRVIARLQLTHLPPEKVFQQEADRDPEAAALLPQVKIQEILHCALVDKYFKEDIDIEDEPSPNDNKSDDDCNSLCKTQICEMICSASSGNAVYCIEEGFYYREICQTTDKLYLVCLKPMCKARAEIRLPDTTTIHIPESSLEHNHEPDLFYRNKLIFLQNLRHRVLTELTPINIIYTDESNREPIGADVTNEVTVMNFMYKLRKANNSKINLENCKITEIGIHPDNEGDDSDDGKSKRLGVKNKSSRQYLPTEILPTRSHNVLYHNGEGYYFHSNAVRGKIMYLRCAESKCKNRGWKSMERDDAPIMPTSSSRPHNHQPDFTHREQLLLVHRCKLRAAAENCSINQIWQEERARDPETASTISTINVKLQMKRYRLDHAEYSPRNPSTAYFNSSVDLNNRNYDLQDTYRDVVPEKIPSLTDETLWHVDGYFYTTQKIINNFVKVKCTEKGCNAVGQITIKEGIPEKMCMAGNSTHSHPADPHRRDQLVFIDRCKRRAADSFETIHDIYDDESNKEPEVASQLSAGRVKRAMMEAKKIHMEKFNYTIDEDEAFEDLSEEHLLSEQNEQEAVTEVKTKTFVPNENSDGLQKDSDDRDDQIYSDFVTLEYGESDQESIDDDAGADFKILPTLSEDKNKEFHDGNGYYYNLVTKDKDTSDPLSAEKILKKDQVQIMTNLGSDIVESKQKEHEESNEIKKSEAIPGLRPGSSIYHDLNGYYFIFNVLRENKRYVRCIEPKCRVRGSMGLYDGAPILTSGKTVHNHQPDLKRKNYLKFFQQCKERAFNEPDKPIMEIFAEEKQKDPVSAAVPGSRNIIKNMTRIRKSLTKFTPTEEDHSEFVDAFLSTSTYSQTSNELNDDDSSSQQNVKSNEFESSETENNTLILEELPSEIPQESTHVAELEEASQLTLQNETLENSLGNGNTVYLYQPSNTTNDRPTFFDDKGYSYYQTTIRRGIRFLRCGEVNCKARASMKVEVNSPVTLSKQSLQHNHQPIQSEITMLLDPSQLVGTADDTPLSFVFTDPLGGEQVTVCHIPDETLSKRTYKPRQTPEITINTEEQFQTEVESGVDVAAGDYYHNEDQQKYPLKPSEVVPGLRPDANNYHDGNGFYYELNRLSQNIRYLKCLTKDCKARAYMEVGRLNAPIIQTNFAKHTHGPDLFRKRFTVFLHRMTRRAVEEDTPINIIYDQEAKRDPESANHIRPENVKQRMMRCRKKHKQNRETRLGNENDTADIYHFLLDDNFENQDRKPSNRHLDSEEIQPNESNEEEKKYEGEVDESSLFEDYVISEVEVESCSQLQNA